MQIYNCGTQAQTKPRQHRRPGRRATLWHSGPARAGNEDWREGKAGEGVLGKDRSIQIGCTGFLYFVRRALHP
eukprot:364443-Chlamydomonas_euryale.AAC.3